MWSFAALCDDFYVTTRLFTKLDLSPSRESVLHFFEQIRKAFPRVARLRRRDDGTLILDEDGGDERLRRHVRIDPNALRIGVSGPTEAAAVSRFVEHVLDHAPTGLSLSDLDYDYMELSLGFDLDYRGNHDELIAETLMPAHPLTAALAAEQASVIECQPLIGVAIGESCETQMYLEVKARTSTFEVRTGEYQENSALTVLLTARRYVSAARGSDLRTMHRELLALASAAAGERVVPLVVQPLAAAIASRR